MQKLITLSEMLIVPKLRNNDFLENFTVEFKITMMVWKMLNLRGITEDVNSWEAITVM